jgi:hypothetical protein
MTEPINHALVTIHDDGAVLYRGRPAGAIFDTGRRFGQRGDEIIWGIAGTAEVAYDRQCAGIDAARISLGKSTRKGDRT